MQTYITLDGRILDLTGLTPDERAYLERCVTAYRAGTPWIAFGRLVDGSENPLLRSTHGRVTRQVWQHPLFQAVSDLEHRLGLAQGEVAPGPDDQPDTDPLADEWITAGEAARRKGVTLAGLHRAIDRGDLLARPLRPGGTWRMVSVASLDHWVPNPVRQAARRGRVTGQAGIPSRGRLP